MEKKKKNDKTTVITHGSARDVAVFSSFFLLTGLPACRLYANVQSGFGRKNNKRNCLYRMFHVDCPGSPPERNSDTRDDAIVYETIRIYDTHARCDRKIPDRDYIDANNKRTGNI